MIVVYLIDEAIYLQLRREEVSVFLTARTGHILYHIDNVRDMPINLPTTKLFIFINRLFINNKDFSS